MTGAHRSLTGSGTAAGPIDPSSSWLRRGWGPVEAGAGLDVVRAAPGHVLFSSPLAPQIVDEDGRVASTVLAALADSCSAVTAYSSLGPEATGPTVELRLDLGDTITPGATSLLPEGRVLQVRERVVTTRVEIRDDAGAILAHVMGMHGVDDQDSTAAQSPQPSFQAGLEPSDLRIVREGSSVLAPLTSRMLNGRGGVHGGALLAIAHAAQAEHHRHEGMSARQLHTTVEFRRPADLPGPLTCHSITLRAGRRFRSVRTELMRPDGAVAAIGTGTAAIIR